jgi:siroheme synthase (precorrin-2 oxidase/ferrochelatase)
MSVTTRADEIIAQVRRDIDSAIKGMASLILEEPWGWDEFGEEYREKVEAFAFDLKKKRKDI